MKENKQKLEDAALKIVTGGTYIPPVNKKECPHCGSTDLLPKPGIADAYICNECGSEIQLW